MKKKRLLNIFFILELVFGLIGTIFSAIGLILHRFIDAIMASANSQGNAEILPSVFLTIGLSFLIVAFMCFMSNYKKQRMIEILKENGVAIWAGVESIDLNRYVEVNRRHPYVITCVYENPVTGEVHRFKSENIFGDASFYEGQEIRVFVDNNNYKCYYVDVDESRINPS